MSTDVLDELREELRSLTMEELSKASGLPAWRLRELVKQGKGPKHFRVGQTYRFPLSDGQVTDDERSELARAIETVLPPEIRVAVRDRRRASEAAGDPSRPLETFDFMVAGVHYEGRGVFAGEMEDGDFVYLVREANNRYSRNAVKVCREDGVQVGYVPEVDACDLSRYLAEDCRYLASVKKVLRRGRVPIPVINAVVYRADSDPQGSRAAADRPPPRAFPELPPLSASQDASSGRGWTVAILAVGIGIAATCAALG